MIVKCKLLFYVLDLLDIESERFIENLNLCELQNGKHTKKKKKKK